MEDLRHFRFWCQKVLPLVYEDSMSYYEVLCRVVKYINDMIENEKSLSQEMEALQAELAIVQKWIAEFDTSYAEQIIADHIATMIFVEITDTGYITYYIPEQWHEITFNTTGLDIDVPDHPEYGRLVLSY